MPQGGVARPTLLLCLPNMPAHAASSSKHLVVIFTEPTTQPQQQWVPTRRAILCIMAEPHTRPRSSYKSRQNGNQRLCSFCQEVTWVDQHAPRPSPFYGQTSCLDKILLAQQGAQGSQTQSQNLKITYAKKDIYGHLVQSMLKTGLTSIWSGPPSNQLC